MSELQDLRTRIKNLYQQLVSLKTELIQEGQKLDLKSRKGVKRYKQIEQLLALISNQKLRIDNYNQILELQKQFADLSDDNKSVKEKKHALDTIVDYFTNFTNSAKEKWSSIAGNFAGENANSILVKLQNDIANLIDKITKSKKVQLNTAEYELELAQKLQIYEIVENYVISENINIDQLKSMVKVKKSSSESKKNIITIDNSLFQKYQGYLNQIEKTLAEIILNNKINIEKESKKSSTKSLLAKINEMLKEHPIATASITSTLTTLIVGLAILTASKGFTNDFNNSKDQTTLTPSPTPDIEMTIKNKLKDDLRDLGYNKDQIDLMVANFTSDELRKIVEKGRYIDGVETYSNSKGFNIDYLQDYENAKITLVVTPAEAVNYVNRAYLLYNAHFFEDLDINQIAELLKAIDKRDKSVDVIDPIYSTINPIATNALYSDTNFNNDEIDLIASLPSLAQKDSDLYNFLNQYSKLLVSIMKNPNNKTAYTSAREYIGIFARNIFNADHSDPSSLSSDKQTNENAMVLNHYDWMVARGTIIATLEIVYPFTKDENLYTEYLDIYTLMDDALKLPSFQEECGNKLS